eukprot:maker-scaffold1644_size32250-snap-gene-0.11 protein:Tk09144 transcript:maker-scaffold1644_size32250-snap-gene-0.11-mRNA-1 annotation:"conserved hypothetical protein"
MISAHVGSTSFPISLFSSKVTENIGIVPSHLPHLGHPAHLTDLLTALHSIPWPLLHPEVVAPPREQRVVLAEVVRLGLDYGYACPLLLADWLHVLRTVCLELRLQVVVYAGLQDTQLLRCGHAGVDTRQGVVSPERLHPRLQLSWGCILGERSRLEILDEAHLGVVLADEVWLLADAPRVPRHVQEMLRGLGLLEPVIQL